MSDRNRPLFKGLVLLSVPLVGGLAAVLPFGLATGQGWLTTRPEGTPVSRGPASVAELVPDKTDTLRLPADVARQLGVRTAKVERATRPRTLTLSGSLALDANRLARVHTRFGGEVVEVSSIPDLEPDGPKVGQSVLRQVQVGDRVQKGQLLAVVWCKDLG